MKRTPHRKYCRLYAPMMDCECGAKVALTEFRMACHYLIFTRDITVMGYKAGNFANDGAFFLLAGKCDCGRESMMSFSLEAMRELLLEHSQMVTAPDDDDILVEEVGEEVN